MINIKGLDKAEVLLALYKGSHTQGVSFLGMKGTFDLEKAKKEIEETPSLYFDYVNGHIIKCDISGDEFDERLYDRDCGEGRAAEVIEALKKGKNIPTPSFDDDISRCFLDLLKQKLSKGSDE